MRSARKGRRNSDKSILSGFALYFHRQFLLKLQRQIQIYSNTLYNKRPEGAREQRNTQIHSNTLYNKITEKGRLTGAPCFQCESLYRKVMHWPLVQVSVTPKFPSLYPVVILFS